MSIRLARAEPQPERGKHDRLEVADERHERERRHADRDEADDDREAAARAAAPERTDDDGRRAEAAEQPADEPAQRLVPVLGEETDADPDERGDEGCDRTSRDEAGGEDPYRGAEADCESDGVPIAHGGSVEPPGHEPGVLPRPY